MDMPDYSLTPPNFRTVQLARRWLALGVAALGLAGVFAGLLANTKKDFFYTALVVHVDLSVLVWFLSQACMFFTLSGDGERFGVLRGASFISFALGTLLLVLSAAFGAEAYMSNYIPVIHHPVFFLGLSLILCGAGIEAVLALACCKRAVWRTQPQRYGVATAAVILLLAMVCFIRSQQSLPADLTGQVYYEYAFWGGGHVLQFVHTQLMIVCWLWLASAGRLNIKLRPFMLTGL
jgi:cytochrome c oxidase subunit 1